MAINGTYVSSKSVETNTTIVLEMLPSRPSLKTAFSPARAPGQLCGYYDSISNRVELYMVTTSGIRFTRVG